MKLNLNAKCSDMFSATLYDDDGKCLGDYDGNVPEFMPGMHFGDYIQLDIDVETGKILNWKRPTAKQLKTVFQANSED